MHEASLVHSLLQQVEDLLRAHGAQRVTCIRVSVGEFAGVEPELFRSAFELMAPQSVARGATLELQTVPLVARCEECQQEFHVERFEFVCPLCQHSTVSIIRGEELTLEDVTLEDSDLSQENLR